MRVRVRGLIAAAAAVWLGIGCQPNHPPAVPSIISSNQSVDSGGWVSLQASSVDPDGDRLGWEWSAEAGEFDNHTSPFVFWQAPQADDTLQVKLMVRVEDERGAADSAFVTVTVVPKEDSPLKEVVVGRMEGNWDVPFDGGIHGFYRYQMLYPGSEIGCSGELEEIYLRPASNAAAYFHNFRLYLLQVSAEELESSFAENYGEGQPVLGYYAPALGFNQNADEWYRIPVSAPFHYGDSMNLLVEIVWKGNNGVTIPTYGYQTSTQRSVGSEFTDALNGLPLSRTLYLKLAFRKEEQPFR